MKSRMISSLCAVAAALAVTFAGCSSHSGGGTKTVAVTSVEIEATDFSLVSGDTKQLAATVLPDNATDKTVSWTSSDDTIATVSEDGLVTALETVGSAVITATSGKCTDMVTVKVVASEDDIEFTPQSVSYASEKLNITPSEATSSDTGVATVSVADGKVTVTSVDSGSVTITVKDSDGKTAIIVLSVSKDGSISQVSLSPYSTDIAVESVSISVSDFSLGFNEEKQLSASVTPANATNQKISWSSSDEAVAKVSASGLVTSLAKAGSATIKATSSNGKSDSVTVTVAEVISFKTSTKEYTASQLNLTPSEVSSSATAVATAAISGTKVVITSVSVGEATITVTESDKTATIVVTVGTDGSITEKSLTAYVEPTGTVSITVSVDGTYKCANCGHGHDTKEAAENCDLKPGCPKYQYTVTFEYTAKDENDTTENASSTIKVVNGEKIPASEIPSWAKDEENYDFSWTNEDGLTIDSAITDDTTFTAQWTHYYTVTFVDTVAGTGDDAIAAEKKETQKVYTAGEATATLPEFASKTTDYSLTWTSSVEGLTPESTITNDVIFTAVWTENTYYIVTYKDAEGGENETTTEKVYEGETPAQVPAWTKEHYTLDWTASVDGLTTTSEITQDVTFTAVWTELPKYTVTFVDSAIIVDDETTINAEKDEDLDEQTIYEGGYAELPSWASSSRENKSAYTVTWTSSVEGLTPESAITADVTFTASWTKTPTETVITFCNDTGDTYTGTGNPTGYAVGNGNKDYGKTSYQSYTTSAGTVVSVRYGVKLNKTGYITLTLTDSYTVLFVQGTGGTTTKGLNIATLGSDGSTYGDAVNYAVVSDGSNVVSASLSAGTYKITNGGSETSVFAIVLLK